MRKTFRRMTRISIYALFGYAAVVVVFLVLESRLVYPVPPVALGNWEPAAYHAEGVFFESIDSTRLHGWYFEHPNPQAQLLFCHGNGEHLGMLGGWADRLRREHRVSIFVFDYRGYGKSEGTPHEHGILQDGEAAMDWLAARAGRPPEEITVYGRSLGGAVAIHVAAEKGARGLIVERTFHSLSGVASRHYPWLPVRTVMRNPYDSIGKLASYDGPLLQMHGTDDALVPIASAKRLFDAAPSKNKRFLSLQGLGHNDPAPLEFDTALEEFLEHLPEFRQGNG